MIYSGDIKSILDKTVRSKQRALLCFDFAYGYPIDFAAALQAATGKSDRELPWLLIWKYLGEHITDDEGTAPGVKPTNRSNRFEVANQINALLSTDPGSGGPFWSASPEAAYRYIPQKRLPESFQTAQGYVVKGLRLTDKRAKSGSPFRLFGTASVGSQSLTGIARLQQLRNDPKLVGVSAVWPFETGWATKAKWLTARIITGNLPVSLPATATVDIGVGPTSPGVLTFSCHLLRRLQVLARLVLVGVRNMSKLPPIIVAAALAFMRTASFANGPKKPVTTRSVASASRD